MTFVTRGGGGVKAFQLFCALLTIIMVLVPEQVIKNCHFKKVFERCIKMQSAPTRILILLYIKTAKMNKRAILYAYKNNFMVNLYQKINTNIKKSRRGQNKFSIKLFEDFAKESLFTGNGT